MKKYIIKIVFSFLSISTFSQELRLVEKNIGTPEAELILLSIDEGNEKIIKLFTQPLILYFAYSYYIDKNKQECLFLS